MNKTVGKQKLVNLENGIREDLPEPISCFSLWLQTEVGRTEAWQNSMQLFKRRCNTLKPWRILVSRELLLDNSRND